MVKSENLQDFSIKAYLLWIKDIHNIGFYGELMVINGKPLLLPCILCQLYLYGDVHVINN